MLEKLLNINQKPITTNIIIIIIEIDSIIIIQNIRRKKVISAFPKIILTEVIQQIMSKISTTTDKITLIITIINSIARLHLPKMVLITKN